MGEAVESVTGTARGSMAARSRSLTIALVALALAGLTLLVPTTVYPGRLAMALSLIAPVIVLAIVRKRQGRLDWFEPYYPIGVLYFLYFGVGVLYHSYKPEEMFSISLRNYLAPALALSVLGFASFTAGYLLTCRDTQPSRWARLSVSGPWPVVVPALLGFAGHMAAVAQEAVRGRGAAFSPALSALQQFAPVFVFASALGFYLLWSGRASAALKNFLIWVFVPMNAIVIYKTVGAKSLAVMLLAIPAIAFWYARRRLPVRTIAAIVLLLVFVIFPVYNTYRIVDRHLDTTERLDRSIGRLGRLEGYQFLDQSLGSFLRRMAVVTSVAAILRDCGKTVDFCYGRTLLLTPITIFIPRFLWPEKPDISIGREFGETFGLVLPIDANTAIAPTILGEFYWNFHLPGVFVGMFLYGFVCRWLYRRFGEPSGFAPISMAVSVTMLITVIFFEANVAGIIGRMVKSYAILAVLIFLLERQGALTANPEEPAPNPAAS